LTKSAAKSQFVTSDSEHIKLPNVFAIAPKLILLLVFHQNYNLQIVIKYYIFSINCLRQKYIIVLRFCKAFHVKSICNTLTRVWQFDVGHVLHTGRDSTALLLQTDESIPTVPFLADFIASFSFV